MEKGCTLWFTGMSGTGKSTLSKLVGQRLSEAGARVEVLDGDVIRTTIVSRARVQQGRPRREHPPYRLCLRASVA